jgi:hypothetical protein
MPLLAQQMDKVAIVRSLTHESNAHESSVYHVLTGKQNPALVTPQNYRKRSDFPNVAAVVSHFSEPGVMPASVTLPGPVGDPALKYAGTYAGFLGPRCDPLELSAATYGRGASALALPADVSATRLSARHGLVELIDAQDRALNQHGATKALGGFYEQAFRMVSSPVAKRAFNLELEPAKLRDRYGHNEYGDSFLLARRLVEVGVRLVSVVWMYIWPHGSVLPVWDNHMGYGVDGAKTGYDLLKGRACLPSLDRAYSALIADLADRGLLDETLVVTVGEFGRSPRINDNGGREHHGKCQSLLLAGGGIRGGQVYGVSDAHAAFVKDNPVSPEDLQATIYHSMGLSPDSEIHDREGRPHRISDGKPVTALFA